MKVEDDQDQLDTFINTKTNESIIWISSLIGKYFISLSALTLDINTFESKINDKYVEYHPKQIHFEELLSFMKLFVKTTQNNSRFYFTNAHGSLEIYIHTLNLPELGYQKDEDKYFSCWENCIKCSPTGVCEMYVDDFIDGNINWFGSNPKKHIVFKEKSESDLNQGFDFNK